MRKWWSFWLGFLRIRIEGKHLEKFINLSANRGVPLFDLRREGPDRMSAKVRLDGFRSLRHVARKTRSKVRIEERSGFPFAMTVVKNRRSIYIGALLFIFTLYILSTFIWDVDVVGNEKVDKQIILEVAQSQGLHVGRWKPTIDLRESERAIMNNVPGLEWVGVYAKGTRIVIEVEEKVMPQTPPVAGVQHIVAAKEGIIQRILVLVGEGKVKEGDKVQKGDLLISGLIYAPEKLDDPSQKEEDKPQDLAILEKVQAKGEVWAQVWYEKIIEEPIHLEGAIPTGEVTSQWRIKWRNQETIIKGPSESPYEVSKEEVYIRTPLLWRNLQIPVELVEKEFYELRPYRQERSVEEAIVSAQDRFQREVKENLTPSARILREVVSPQPAEPNLVKVKITIETLENIATSQTFEGANP
ncbi:sporulation protein YqfD [Heliorestis acidaminivorans]|uniref:Sporulation protein YqfD n=1 Tax=Heliorestis acidaminivorans TaxID=553427 RepID=A0A6I0EZX5_9FIRM|nr:sporulation protein YqfD [Heliorestis acidaminivorans]KAB2952282.1 sporulation protein YqfD [Heliorestis acidaminivorans]